MLYACDMAELFPVYHVYVANCGKVISTDHAMICYMGEFPTMRHNEIRDITVFQVTEVCLNVTMHVYKVCLEKPSD